MPLFVNEKIFLNLYLVGRNPTKKMFALAKEFSPNIVINGEVNSLDEYYKDSKIFVSPLFNGSGMKNKIIQAMAFGLPIIANKESISGIINSNFIIPESLADWHYEIMKLLQNLKLTKKIGDNNREIFNLHYSWDSIIKKYYSKLFLG
jgi:glycosyltransferase involved in cell wall biosynthesis